MERKINLIRLRLCDHFLHNRVYKVVMTVSDSTSNIYTTRRIKYFA
jgi:hypothetical protein